MKQLIDDILGLLAMVAVLVFVATALIYTIILFSINPFITIGVLAIVLIFVISLKDE